MSKYGDDYVCSCEMNLVSCRNEFHAEKCELWNEESFKTGLDEWDGDLGCLVLAQSPWDNAEQWIWNGDTPVIRKDTAEDRQQATIAEVVAEWEGAQSTIAELAPVVEIPALEQEALDALCAGETQDEYGMVCLEDGSYADFEVRVTYRRVMADGKPQWLELFWDQDDAEATDAAVEVVEADGWSVCTCTPAKKFYCSTHNCQRDKESDPWRYWAGHTATSSTTYTTNYGSWHRCNHCFETFVLPGEQHENIKISAKRFHGAGTTPDYGVYAYAGWDPDCVATFIPWQDYGLPKVEYAKAAQAIVHAWELSCAGKVVEVGCMGGHGRTGTILGCLAILSNPEMSARAAVNHVRKVHCEEAIETNEQEWFVAWFRAWYLGESCPPKPTTYVSKHSANWQKAGQAAVAVKNTEPTLPLAQTSLEDGQSTKRWVWCSFCKRTVRDYHNGGCPMDTIPAAPELPVAEPLEFDRALYESGQTANARRRNAKRANRRAARKAKQAARMPQEYV